MRIEIYGGPEDGRTLEIADGATHLLVVIPMSLAGQDAAFRGPPYTEEDAELLERHTHTIRMPIVGNRAIWPQEKGDTR